MYKSMKDQTLYGACLLKELEATDGWFHESDMGEKWWTRKGCWTRLSNYRSWFILNVPKWQKAFFLSLGWGRWIWRWRRETGSNWDVTIAIDEDDKDDVDGSTKEVGSGDESAKLNCNLGGDKNSYILNVISQIIFCLKFISFMFESMNQVHTKSKHKMYEKI